MELKQYHSENSYTSESIAEEQTQWASSCKGSPNSQKEPCTNGTSKCNKLNMSGFQSVTLCQRLKEVPTGHFFHLPTMNIAILLCRCDVTVHSSCLGNSGVVRMLEFVWKRRMADVFLSWRIWQRSGTGLVRHVANKIKLASLECDLDFKRGEGSRNATIPRIMYY